jgi:type I restriction enzyme, S subunit
MSLPRYKKSKESGVEWLDNVPEHWSISRLGFESWVRARLGWKGLKAEEYVEDGYVLLSTPNIKGANIDFENVNYITDVRYDESPEIKVQVGDVLLAKDGSTLGTVNVVRYLPRPTTVNSSIAVITPKGAISGVFLYYLFRSSFMENTIQRIKGGMGVPHLFQEDLNKFYIPLPPIDEQQAIAIFLDREMASVETLIAEQQLLIKLLTEKRRALISHALTQGLNAAARMKASGVDWLGEVPAHWQVVRLGTLFREVADPGNDDLPLLSVSIHHGVSDREFDEDELDRKVTRSDDRTKYKCVQVGDLVYNMMRAWQGGFGTVAVPGMVSPAYVVARPITPIRTELIEQLLRTPTAVEELRRHSHGVTDFRLRLYWDEFKTIKVAVPPPDEQHDVLAFLDRETTKFDALTAEAENAITLLQERRTALVSAAVTGKIDVRGQVATQPKAEIAA